MLTLMMVLMPHVQRYDILQTFSDTTVFIYMYICLYIHQYVDIPVPRFVHIQMQMHTHAHTYTDTYTDLHSHSRSRLQLHSHLHFHLNSHLHVHAHFHVHAQFLFHLHLHLHSHLHLHLHLHLHVHLRYGMVWYGMDSLNVRCTFIDKWSDSPKHWPLQLSCSVGPGRVSSISKHRTLLPAPQALCLRVALLREMLVTQKVTERSVEARATGFTKTAKWHHCDNAALLRWHYGHVAPDAVVVHNMLD